MSGTGSLGKVRSGADVEGSGDPRSDATPQQSHVRVGRHEGSFIACAEVGCVGLVRVDVHLECIARFNAHNDIAEDEVAFVRVDGDFHNISVFDPVHLGMLGAHMNVALRLNYALAHSQGTCGPYEGHPRCILNLTRASNWGIHSEMKFISSGDLDLCLSALRTDDSDPFDASFWPHKRDALLRDELTRLGEWSF